MDIYQTDISPSKSSPSTIISTQALNITSCFWIFVSIHLFVWTLLPTLLRSTLPIDALEGVVWGSQLELGYDRNPWLNAWLTRLAMEIGGHYGWMIYLFSQICVITAFWSVWQLGKKILTPSLALVSVMMLEAIQYYTLASVDFNDNVLELALWPLLALYFYQAIMRQNLRNWLAVGVVAGLALMAKYYTAIYLLSLCVFLIIEPKARGSLKEKNFYLGLFVFFLIILPHTVWLFFNNFEPIRYAMDRVNDNTRNNLWYYVQPGIKFAALQLLNFLGAVVLVLLILKRGKADPRAQIRECRSNVDSGFNNKFLWIVGAGTYIFTVLLALITGWQLHLLWGMPLLSLWGLLLLAYLPIQLTQRRLIQFFAAVSSVFLGYALAYAIPMAQKNNTSSGNFPAKSLSKSVLELWEQKYHKPLIYVAGDRYLGGYISLYADKPSTVYMDWDKNKSPWINEEKLRKEGAVFVQLAKDGEQFPESVLQRFPNLEDISIQSYQRPRSNAEGEPVRVLVGFLPPQDALTY